MDYELSLSPKTIQLLKTRSPDDAKVIAALADDIISHAVRLVTVLDPYRTDKDRGAIMEDTIKIPDEGLTIKDDLTGIVAFEFDEDAYYGCKDQNNVHENSDDMGFTIDLKKGVVVLHAIDLPERPEEEF